MQCLDLFIAPLERFGWRLGRFLLVLLPLILMEHRLNQEWVRNFCVIETVGLLLFVSTTLDIKGISERSVLPWLGGVVASMAIILGIELTHGATPRGLADGIIFQHLHFPTQAMQEGFVPSETLYAAAISIVLFLVLHLNRRNPPFFRRHHADRSPRAVDDLDQSACFIKECNAVPIPVFYGC